MPAGVLDCDARHVLLAQPSAQHREALHEPGADEHVLDVCVCASHAREVVPECLAQLRRAPRVAVADGLEWRLLPGRAQRAQPALAGESCEVG